MTPGEAGAPGWHAIETEAAALLAEATGERLMLRVVGSTGIRMHCRPAAAAMDRLGRGPKDLDLICRAGGRKALRGLLDRRGYAIDRDVLVAMEGTRFAFLHPDTGIELDIFVDRLEFCHTMELGTRLDRHPTTLPIEDLLLQKLQMHEMTRNDVLDATVVLVTHDVAESAGDPERIDPSYLAGLLARDWGFHRTVTDNLRRMRTELGGPIPGLAEADARLAADRVETLSAAIGDARKSVSWRMRARIGERVQWWRDVNERTETY